MRNQPIAHLCRQEDFARAKGINNQVKTIRAALEKDVQKRSWVPASNIKPCNGCGVVGDKRKPCNQCQLNELMRKKHEGFAKATKEKNKKLMNTKKQKQKKEELTKKDQDFVTKFGLLKKASVLVNSERWADAYRNILQAIKMVKKERDDETKYREEKEKKIKQKLQIPLDLNIDYAELISEPITKARLDELGINVPLQQVQVLIEKMCGQDANSYSKHQFLNAQIVELFEAIYYAIKDKRHEIEKMKKRVETLENNPESTGRKLKTKTLASSTTMCEKIKKGGKI